MTLRLLKAKAINARYAAEIQLLLPEPVQAGFDSEVKRLLDEAYGTAMQMLEANRQLALAVCAALDVPADAAGLGMAAAIVHDVARASGGSSPAALGRSIASGFCCQAVFALLVAWVLTRGLSPLEQTTRSVSDRDASRLDPLPVRDVPQELLPLVGQINALLERLSGALEAQRRFVADAAHELRSPVAALALQAQLAARAEGKDARVAAYAELERGIDRTERLVEQLLDLARLEPGVPTEAREPVDVARLAREVVGSFAARADAAGVDLGADAPGPARLTGGREELRSLLANLVDNALRYAPRGSEVTVAARNSGARVELEVSDAGPGIPPEQRARVLERFQRVEGDPASGSGLGLAIAKTIVERYGGEIELADAHPGSPLPGLSVRITLPV